jgi:hypothetical protein
MVDSSKKTVSLLHIARKFLSSTSEPATEPIQPSILERLPLEILRQLALEYLDIQSWVQVAMTCKDLARKITSLGICDFDHRYTMATIPIAGESEQARTQFGHLTRDSWFRFELTGVTYDCACSGGSRCRLAIAPEYGLYEHYLKLENDDGWSLISIEHAEHTKLHIGRVLARRARSGLIVTGLVKPLLLAGVRIVKARHMKERETWAFLTLRSKKLKGWRPVRKTDKMQRWLNDARGPGQW